MSGSAIENSILLSVLTRLNKIFNQLIKQSYFKQISSKILLLLYSLSTSTFTYLHILVFQKFSVETYILLTCQ